MSNSLGNKEIMAKNLTYYMNKNGITRQKLSSDLNIKYTTLTDWIKGKTYPRIDKIELLSNYFNINKSDLVEEHSFEKLDITNVFKKLNEKNQKEIYNLAEKRLKEQNSKVTDLPLRNKKIESVDLAAHSEIDNREYTDEQIEGIAKYLDQFIDE